MKLNEDVNDVMKNRNVGDLKYPQYSVITEESYTSRPHQNKSISHRKEESNYQHEMDNKIKKRPSALK